VPSGEEIVVDSVGQEAVDDDVIDREAVESEIDEGALGFAEHHLFGVGDETDAGELRIFQNGIDAFDFLKEFLDVAEVTIGRQFGRRDAVEHGARGFKQAALETEDVFHVPIERGGKADEAQRFGSGRAIENDDVEIARLAVLIDIHHGAEFFHAGEDGHFLGFDAGEAGGAQDAGDVAGNILPVALEFVIDVDLLEREVVGDFDGIESGAVEEGVFEVEGIGKAVSGVNAHNEGPLALGGQVDSGGASNTGFAHTAFATEE